MSPPSPTPGSRASRRTVLAAVAGAGAAGLAGCLDGEPGAGTPTTDADATDTQSGDDRPTPPPTDTTLTGDGSSTMYPVTSQAAAVWNSNPPPGDESWRPGRYGVDTDLRVADYWGSLYGFSDAANTQPPFLANVGLSNSRVGCQKVREGKVDFADASAPVTALLPDASLGVLAEFVDHVVGVDAQPLVVSREVRDAGVARLTATQVERIYRGEIERWGEIPAYTGPDKEIQVVGRSAGSGSAAAFRANLLGSSDTELDGVDVRKDQSQQVETLVANADNAVAYLALAFVHPDGQVPPVALEVDGTTYEYGRNFDAPDYPLARDLHVYTYGGTSEKEAAFVRMLLSDYGQRTFVASNGYLPLPPARRRAQRRDLPGTVRDSSESPAETESETETTSS